MLRVSHRAVGRQIEQHGACGRKLLEARGQKRVELTEGWFVKQVFVWVVAFGEARGVLYKAKHIVNNMKIFPLLICAKQ